MRDVYNKIRDIKTLYSNIRYVIHLLPEKSQLLVIIRRIYSEDIIMFLHPRRDPIDPLLGEYRLRRVALSSPEMGYLVFLLICHRTGSPYAVSTQSFQLLHHPINAYRLESL